MPAVNLDLSPFNETCPNQPETDSYSRPASPAGHVLINTTERAIKATGGKLGSLYVAAGTFAFFSNCFKNYTGYFSESTIKTALVCCTIGSKYGVYSFDGEELSTSQKLLGTISSTFLSSAGIYGSQYLKDFTSLLFLNISDTNLLTALNLAPIPAVLLFTYFCSKEAGISKYFNNVFHTYLLSTIFFPSLNVLYKLDNCITSVFQQMAFLRIGKDLGGIWGAKLGQKLGKKLDERVIAPIKNRAIALFDRAKSKVSQIFFKTKKS